MQQTQAKFCCTLEGEKEQEAELENPSERLGVAFGLINVKPGTPTHIVKSLSVSNDRHGVMKLSSKIQESEIVVREKNSCFHHFKNWGHVHADYW